MQGIIVTPNGDVWAVDFTNDDVVYLPQGDPSKVKFYCESTDGKPNKDSPCKLSGPFHLVIDQQNRIWVDNAIGDKVARFPASDPTQSRSVQDRRPQRQGHGGRQQGQYLDHQHVGCRNDASDQARLLDLKIRGRMADADQIVLNDLLAKHGLGSVSMLRPDGSPAPGSPFNPPAASGAHGRCRSTATTMSGFPTLRPAAASPSCAARGTETCPLGMKTGDAISPPGGYKGGGMQMLVDVSIDPAGNVWVSNNWQDPASCYGQPDEGRFDPLWRPGNDGLLRHGQTGARAADRPSPRVLGHTQINGRRNRESRNPPFFTEWRRPR